MVTNARLQEATKVVFEVIVKTKQDSHIITT